jgi:ketopantoate reductase
MPFVHKFTLRLALLGEVGIITSGMEISILGPGAVGTLLGGLLSLKGHRVSLVGKSAPAQPDSVLRIVLPGGWHEAPGVRQVGPPGAPASPDASLVTLGRHHLHVLRRPDFARLTGTGESPVALFNADLQDVDRMAVAPERLRLCVTLLNAVKLQENEVELGPDKGVILYERARALDHLFRDLGGFGIQAVAVDDARPFLNSLLVWQLLWLPVAMCNTTLQVFLSFPEGRELAAGILSEGCAAMEKAGLPMAALPVMDPRELAARIEKRPESFPADTESPDRRYNSLLQSYLRGKPTEAPRLNRRVVEIGSAGGLHLTWNWRILQKVSRVSGIGFYRTPADLLHSLA